MDNNEAMKMLEEAAEHLPDCQDRMRESLNTAVSALKKAEETADWIPMESDGDDPEGNPVYDLWACGKCWFELRTDGDKPGFKYCPDCGVKIVNDSEQLRKTKKGLVLCSTGNSDCPEDCPYLDDDDCQRNIAADALKIITRLETKIAVLKKEMEKDGDGV